MQIIVNVFFTFLKAFVVGGGICVIAQLLINLTKMTTARILVSFLLAGALLQAVGVYEKLVNFAGAGASVPLTGFGYLISEGVRKAVDERGLLGALTGSLTAAAGGTAAALVFGLIAALFVRSKPKR